MSIATWNDEQLNALRQCGDTAADALVTRLYENPPPGGSNFGRLGYNQFLNLTDKIVEAPSLVFANNSEVFRQLGTMPPEFVNYFDPMILPAWVDESKIALASQMWMDNSLGMLAVLFLGSLPACYLMAKGIPALYQTDKLGSQRYISQRIYETGIMLDAVMGPGGMQITKDIPGTPHEAAVATLNKQDPTGAWKVEGRSIRRTGQTPPVAVTPDQVNQGVAEHEATSGPQRFVWGSGYVTIKKVRFLHASMRYMLLKGTPLAPSTAIGAPTNLYGSFIQRSKSWDIDDLGLPVNQEDLAYTLLTFGYMIPAGLEKWGCKFTDEQKAAFLHLWRLVGFVLGVEDRLMTDDWTEAGAIFRRIQKHQAATSADGIKLNTVLMEFMQDYTPHYFGLNRILPPLAIRDLVGAEAEILFAPDVLKASQGLWPRGLWFCVRFFVRVYYHLRTNVLRHFPGVKGLFANLHHISDGLIASCRGAYVRRPFYIPVNENTWVPQVGADPEFVARLTRWRHSVFNWVFLSIGGLFVGMLGGLVAFVFWILNHQYRSVALWISLAGWCLAYLAMEVVLPKILASRPVLEDDPGSVQQH